MKDTTIAVGLAKNVFEIAISREAGKVSKQLRVSRPKFGVVFCETERCHRASRSLRLGSLLGKDVATVGTRRRPAPTSPRKAVSTRGARTTARTLKGPLYDRVSFRPPESGKASYLLFWGSQVTESSKVAAA